MTDRTPEGPASDPAASALEPVEPMDRVDEAGDSEHAGPVTSRPTDTTVPSSGPATFSLEGRAVPALYLIGWVGSILGLSLSLVSVLGGGSGAPWLFVIGLVLAAIGFLAAGGSQAIERGRRPDLPYRGPSPVLAFAAVIPITVLGIILILAPLSALGLDVASPVGISISLVLTTAVYVGVVRLLVVGTGALSWREMGLIVPAGTAVRELLVGAAWALPILVLTGFVGLALRAVMGPDASPPSPLPVAPDAIGIAFNLLSAAVLAPIGEELFFRGFVTTAWRRALGAWPAIVRGAVFFSLAHVVTLFDTSAGEGAQRALYAFVVRLPVGIALGWLFIRRGSLWAPIGLHAVFNGLQVAALTSISE